jgi:parallel beta-helix repeat protein
MGAGLIDDSSPGAGLIDDSMPGPGLIDDSTPRRMGPCDKFAAPWGRDSNVGSARRPYRTTQRLVRALARDNTVGCLRRGVYRGDVTISRSHVTLRSRRGERATIVGRLRIEDSANFVTVTQLRLDGGTSGGLPSPSVYGDDALFRRVDVTNRHTEICFLLGSSERGRAYRASIVQSRIHGCGELPPTNLDHGIYVARAMGTRIVGNLIYDNADRGIKLGPDAQRSLVRGNVIDGNGTGITFSGDEDSASSDNVVEHNVIANSRTRWNVESFFPSMTGSGNLAAGNCVWASNPDDYYRSNGGIESNPDGFSATDNVVAEPRYADRNANDFRLPADSPCRAQLEAGG